MSKGNSAERLEDELDRAKARGRWLSDDEQAALDREADAEALLVEAKQQRDRKLMILAGVCLLIPPLWPVALGLTLFLLYPDTCLLYTSPSPRDMRRSRMPSSA